MTPWKISLYIHTYVRTYVYDDDDGDVVDGDDDDDDDDDDDGVYDGDGGDNDGDDDDPPVTFCTSSHVLMHRLWRTPN